MLETFHTHDPIVAYFQLGLENQASMEGDSPPVTIHDTTPGKLPTSTYEQLYRECYTQAYSRAYYLLHHVQDAEDAVQAAYCEVWKQWPHLEPRGLQSYLLRAVKCKAIEILRSKYRRQLSIEAQQIDMCVSWDVDTMLDLTTAREKLNPKLQVVLDLRAEGYTWAEIAEQVGITHDCLNKRFYMARVQLRKQVAA